MATVTYQKEYKGNNKSAKAYYEDGNYYVAWKYNSDEGFHDIMWTYFLKKSYASKATAQAAARRIANS